MSDLVDDYKDAAEFTDHAGGVVIFGAMLILLIVGIFEVVYSLAHPGLEMRWMLLATLAAYLTSLPLGLGLGWLSGHYEAVGETLERRARQYAEQKERERETGASL